MEPKKLTGYADPLSAAPGERVRFMVSCYAPGSYRADLVRLICGDVTPDGAGFQEEEIETSISAEYPGREQPIFAGSSGCVGPSPVLRKLESLSVQALVWPTTPHKGEQAIVATWSEPERAGFALLVDENGGLALRLGDGAGRVESVHADVPLRSRRWCFVAATYDAETGEAHLFQEPLPFAPGDDTQARSADVVRTLGKGLCGARDRLSFAAWEAGQSGGRPVTGAHFNGKIEAPRLTRRALDRREMDALRGSALPARLAEDVVGFWDFAADIGGDGITDRSPHGLAGETLQLPTRAVTGACWAGDVQSWRQAPEQYAAIHFHDDDLYDAGWQVDFELEVPRDLPSGVYAARLRLGDSEDYVPFFVRPARGTATAPVAFLAATCTYMAYANQRIFLSPRLFGDGRAHDPGEQLMLDHPEFGPSQYEHHSDGSGVHYSSRLRPVMNLKPKTTPWSFNADTSITAWLEHQGFRHDVITDEDLHAEGVDLLARYRVVVTGAHPEYYSTAMLDAVEAYLRGGGRLMYMGGNGFYWRIAFHPTRPGVIEVRRAEDGTRAWISEPGEYYHAWSGEYGGLWRRLQRAPQRLVGVGFAAQGFSGSTYYRKQPGSKDPRAAFLFEGVSDDEILGDYGSVGGGAAGYEIDRCDFRIGSPPHTLVLASSEKHKPSVLRTKEEFFATTARFEDRNVRADLVFFECPNGGAVFSTGSIAWSGSLAHDGYRNDVCRITSNALRRFADPEPFEVPGVA